MEIKFRAWDKKEKKMYEVVSMSSGVSNGVAGWTVTMDRYRQVEDSDQFGGHPEVVGIGDQYDVNPDNNILMQFTGLFDKNEKEICEGDKIKMYIFDSSPVPKEIITSVFRHEGMFAVFKMNEEPLSLRDAIKISNKTKQGVEVVGDIYQK